MQIEARCVGTLRPAVPGTELVVDGIASALCAVCGCRAAVAGGVLGPHSALPPGDWGSRDEHRRDAGPPASLRT